MGCVLTKKPDSEEKRRKSRNWAVFTVLIFFAALIYAVTMVRLGLGG